MYKSIGLSGGGFAGAYEVGALMGLVEKKVINLKTVRAAGASAGALSLGFCSGVSLNATLDAAMEIVDNCAADPYLCYGTLGAKVTAALDSYIPKGPKAWMQCNKRMYIQLSQAKSSQKPPCPLNETTPTYIIKSLLINQFSSRNDFINALAGSAFLIPVSNLDVCSRDFRKNVHVVDGGYTDILPCPPGKDDCLQISTYYKGQLPFTGDIYPGMRGNGTLPIEPAALYDMSKLNAQITKPRFSQLVQAGYLDALFWYDKQITEG